MVTRPASDEALYVNALSDRVETQAVAPQEELLQRILPGCNADRQDRARAWADWQAGYGQYVLARYVRAHNNTFEADDDVIQDTLIIAYLSVEQGTFQPRDGVPFSAYVIGIARNKIREARRKERFHANLDDEPEELERRLVGEIQRQPERTIERREQHELLRSGLSRLPAARRQVLEHYLSGASTGEIADHLSMSEALVRQHKCRGLRALQNDLQSSALRQNAGPGLFA
jgi:RNA polymerase sigma factor (sigma-70 family)